MADSYSVSSLKCVLLVILSVILPNCICFLLSINGLHRKVINEGSLSNLKLSSACLSWPRDDQCSNDSRYW